MGQTKIPKARDETEFVGVQFPTNWAKLRVVHQFIAVLTQFEWIYEGT